MKYIIDPDFPIAIRIGIQQTTTQTATFHILTVVGETKKHQDTIPNQTNCPVIVDSKTRFGDLEIDTIINSSLQKINLI